MLTSGACVWSRDGFSQHHELLNEILPLIFPSALRRQPQGFHQEKTISFPYYRPAVHIKQTEPVVEEAGV